MVMWDANKDASLGYWGHSPIHNYVVSNPNSYFNMVKSCVSHVCNAPMAKAFDVGDTPPIQKVVLQGSTYKSGCDVQKSLE